VNLTSHSDRFRNPLAKRGALLGLLAILLGQVSLAAHDLVFDHADDETCVVCTLSDRPDDAPGLAEYSYPATGAEAALAPTPAALPASNTPLDLSARGPPAYL